jgi:hypothetical protein
MPWNSMAGLTPLQQDAYKMIQQYNANPATGDIVPDPTYASAPIYGYDGPADLAYWVMNDRDFDGVNYAPEGQGSGWRSQELNRIASKYKSGDNAYNSQVAREQAKKYVENNLDFAIKNPNGDDDWMDKVMETAMPMIVGGIMTGGALSAFGVGGGAAGGAAGAAADGGIGSVGAASAGSAAGGGFGSFSPYITKGLTSMGVKAGTNLLSGKSLTDGVLQAGVFSGLGSAASSFGGNFVGNSLSNLGLSPETVDMLKAPITSGAMATGTGLLRGQSFGDALMSGLQNGTISFGGQELNDYLKNSGLSKEMTNIVGGAGKGAMTSVIKGNRDPLSSILGGAANGAWSAYGSGLLGGSNSTPASGNNNMSGINFDDLGYNADGDTTDWLGGLYNNLSDPLNFKNSTDFTNYGLDDDNSYTTGDAMDESGNFGDLLSSLGGSSGSSGSGSSGGFLDNLFKQLGNVGSNAAKNPLSAIASALGAYGALRNATGHAPSDLGLVDQLMQKGQAQMNSAPMSAHPFINAKDPRFFTQNYDAKTGAATPIGPDPMISDTYKALLHRAPDTPGADWWKQQLAGGATPDQFKQALLSSDEYRQANAIGGAGPLTKVGG